ncbi:hypothetical protein T05_6687 [Trichinella murrelli]|uniref:Uncharacterized protein n=1 Tax=Trichinella murrelli TaxID=144512 RepID=A0A0V0TQV6_9BILA|nr:hypothetical protein T05_6687 [Trichinella murrelli]
MMDCINKHGEEDFFVTMPAISLLVVLLTMCAKKKPDHCRLSGQAARKFDFFYYGKNRAHDDDDRKSIDKNGQPKLLDTLQGENIAKLLLSQHCRTQQQFYVLTIGFEFEGHQFAGR